jgi:hypothetical protein
MNPEWRRIVAGKNKKKKKVRNLHALNAILRRAPVFKHKCKEKGGSNNWRNNREDQDS